MDYFDHLVWFIAGLLTCLIVTINWAATRRRLATRGKDNCRRQANASETKSCHMLMRRHSSHDLDPVNSSRDVTGVSVLCECGEANQTHSELISDVQTSMTSEQMAPQPPPTTTTTTTTTTIEICHQATLNDEIKSISLTRNQQYFSAADMTSQQYKPITMMRHEFTPITAASCEFKPITVTSHQFESITAMGHQFESTNRQDKPRRQTPPNKNTPQQNPPTTVTTWHEYNNATCVVDSGNAVLLLLLMTSRYLSIVCRDSNTWLPCGSGMPYDMPPWENDVSCVDITVGVAMTSAMDGLTFCFLLVLLRRLVYSVLGPYTSVVHALYTTCVYAVPPTLLLLLMAFITTYKERNTDRRVREYLESPASGLAPAKASDVTIRLCWISWYYDVIGRRMWLAVIPLACGLLNGLFSAKATKKPDDVVNLENGYKQHEVTSSKSLQELENNEQPALTMSDGFKCVFRTIRLVAAVLLYWSGWAMVMWCVLGLQGLLGALAPGVLLLCILVNTLWQITCNN